MAESEAEELRQLIREAHEALKDLRGEIKNAQGLEKRLVHDFTTGAALEMNRVLEEFIPALNKRLKETEEAHQRMQAQALQNTVGYLRSSLREFIMDLIAGLIAGDVGNAAALRKLEAELIRVIGRSGR